MRLSRRQLLTLAVGSGGVAAGTVLFSPQSTAAITDPSFSVNNSTITTPDGTITDVVIEGSSTAEFNWEGFESTETATINFNVRATDTTTNSHLSSGAKSYDTILSTDYSLPDTSGSVSISFTDLYSSTSFPVSIPGNHSGMAVSDFESSADNSTRTTELEYQLDISATSASATTSKTGLVDVTNENTYISGTVTQSGTAVSNATVFVVDAATDSLVARTTTDSNGQYSVDVGNGEYHVMAQYEDANGNQYNDYSKPFLVVG